jgi:hypothetical protein
MPLKKRVLVSYSTEHLLKKDKVRFFYALNGRDVLEGILKRTKTERLGRSVLMLRPEHLKEYREFLGYWKCQWREMSIFMK